MKSIPASSFLKADWPFPPGLGLSVLPDKRGECGQLYPVHTDKLIFAC
jgi:hypothetical protein